MKIEGNRVIIVHAKDGNQKHIYNILYSPSINQNFFNVGQMMKNRQKLIFDDVCYEIINKKVNQKVAIFQMNSSNIFLLSLKSL